MNGKKIFISYSWDSESHCNWVQYFANKLEEYDEISVAFDKYDLDSTEDKNFFMERAVFSNEYILVVVTEGYVRKSNERLGGVGIETKLATSRHWEHSEKIGNSKIIPILRQGCTLPNYLKEKFYIDFRDESGFESAFKRLLNHLKDEEKVKRPAKRHSLSTPPPHRDLTRIEDFIKINHKKRSLVFDRSETTDYSSGKKIKFELWRTRSPSISYYLFLFDNVNIGETVKRLCSLVRRDGVELDSLTVLKTRGSEKGYLDRLFKENGLNVSLTELTYSEYIWDFCIDDDAKINDGVYKNPFFIDQPLSFYHGDENDLGPAFVYIKDKLEEQDQTAAKIIIAPGGTGKTTLCQYIADHFKGSDQAVPVLIQSEELKAEGAANPNEKYKIESVYDLYEVYAKICGLNEEDEFVFDKLTFETAILTGKLVLIIDGMDEFFSLFPESFDIELFLDSVNSLNQELGASKIIITSRNDVFNDEILDKYDGLSKYKILGFDSQACTRYLRRRFRRFDDGDRELMIGKVLSNIDPLIQEDKNKRILPFVVDLLSSICEDSSNEERLGLELNFDGKSYESNEEITDYLVYSVLRRESVRQSLEISIDDMLYIFLEISACHKDSFPKRELEEIIELLHSENANNLTAKVLRNPLIHMDGEICRFKYDFISDYFRSLYIINSLNQNSKNDDLLKLLAKHAQTDNEVLKQVSKYFKRKPDSLFESAQRLVKSIIHEMRNDEAFSSKDINFKAISFFVRMLSVVYTPLSKAEFTQKVKGLVSESNNINSIGVYGENKPMDFSNTVVTNCKFISYEGFSASNFENARFVNCYFDNIGDSSLSESFSPDMFESCRLGNLENTIETVRHNKERNRNLVEKEVRRFFSSFFHRGNFRDQKRAYIKLSDRVRGINGAFFKVLLRKDIIVLKVEKSDEKYYMVSSNYEDSVYGFLVNNRVDKKIEEVLDLAAA